MTAGDLRQNFLKFFEEKGHKVLPSASLVPENDPSALFISAGMQPLVPYLLGEKHPEGKRLANVQKCIRTDDIDEVGDKFHHTFFEMLGNWSLGDYFKEDSISWSFELLTDAKGFKLDKDRLAVSVFAGDKDADFDQEAYDLWVKAGIAPERIAKLPKKNNWWGAGETGPCGPDTEIFYWTGKEKAPANFQETSDDPSWVEIWNNVFIQFDCKGDKKYIPIEQKDVDTGMGMERMLAVMNGVDDDYRTELFWPIIEKLEELSGQLYDEKTAPDFRIVADHIKAASFAISDGATPSNKGAGYIVRRLIRRAIIKADRLGITESFAAKIAGVVFEIYRGVYDLKEEIVLAELGKEELKFRHTLDNGIAKIESLQSSELSGEQLFDLYQSFGFPLEQSLEVAKEKKITIKSDAADKFKELLRGHQELSRTASAGMFKGGLADAGEETTKLHTAAHLLLASLRKVLGDEVLQKGSNITAERLRFDFSYGEKMTPEQVEEVENLVNAQIEKGVPVEMEEMTLEEAKKSGAMGVFESKYGEKVKVYSIGQFSREICGGPHVKNTSELGHFKISKEESSSAGVRRIKAVLE